MDVAHGRNKTWVATSRAFFTVAGVSSKVSPAGLRALVDTAKSSGADTLMFLVELDGYALWPSDVVKRNEVTSGVDVVGIVREACRVAGLRFIAMWMGCHCQSLHIREHPTWMQRDAVGNPNATMCLNSPYAGLLLQQVAEVVEAYSPDAIYFDGLYCRLGGCYCQYCERHFRDLFGHAIPRLNDPAADDIAPEQREHWISFSAEPVRGDPELDEFRFRTVAGFLDRTRQTLVGNPSVSVLLDTLGVTAAFYTNAHDLRRMARFVDGFILESYWEHLGEPVWHVGFEAELVRAETRRPVWWARWLARHPDGNQVPVPAATVDIWAAQTIVRRTPPIVAEQNLYQVDRTLERTVGSALETVRDANEVLDSATPLKYAALVHSPRTKLRYHSEWRSREYFDCLEGSYQILLENHLPVDIVVDEDLTLESLADYRVVILPNVVDLDRGAEQTIADYVARGGGVVATYLTSLGVLEVPDQNLRLGELLGVRFQGVGHRSGRVGPEQFGGREPVNYVRGAAAHELTRTMDGQMGSFHGSYARVVASSQHDVAASILTTNYRLMDGSRYFSWFPGSEEGPYVVTGTSGKGRTAYFSGDPGAALFREGTDLTTELLVRAVEWAAGRPPDVRVDAPPTVDSHVARDPVSGALYVALANRTSHDLYATGRPSMTESGPNGSTSRRQPARAVVPVAGVTITVPGAVLAKSVRSVRGTSLDLKKVKGATSIVVTRLDGHDLIVVEDPGR